MYTLNTQQHQSNQSLLLHYCSRTKLTAQTVKYTALNFVRNLFVLTVSNIHAHVWKIKVYS